MQIERPTSKQPIPANARLVFKGNMFDVYQWEQKMFDGSVQTFEKLKRPDTVGIIPVTADKKIVLTRQEQPGTAPFIGTLGGRIDEGEDPLTAAKRELLEEAGMTADKFILWDSTQLIEKIDWAIYTFIARDCRKAAEQNTDTGEKIKLLYVTFDEFIEITKQDNYRDAELALKIHRITKTPEGLSELRKTILG